MITYKDWSGTGKGFSELVSGKEYPDCYRETLYDRMKEPVEVDEEMYEYFRSVLPPFGIKNGFQCSEPVYSGSFNTFTEKDGRYWYHGHGPRGTRWLSNPFSFLRIHRLLDVLQEVKLQKYAATELTYVLRYLRGETELAGEFSNESLVIVKDFYKKEGYSFEI